MAGNTLSIDTDTPTGSLDTLVVVFDADGNFVAFNDESGGTHDSHLDVPITVDARYFVLVGGFPSFLADPFDSGSGFGPGTEGPYDVTITMAEPDVDVLRWPAQGRRGRGLGRGIRHASGCTARPARK